MTRVRGTDRARAILRLLVGLAFVVFILVDIYQWVGAVPDPPVTGFYAMLSSPDFWVLFHAFLFVCLGAGILNAADAAFLLREQLRR